MRHLVGDHSDDDDRQSGDQLDFVEHDLLYHAVRAIYTL